MKCGGRPSENVGTRDVGPAAVKRIHSKQYFLSLIGTKRGFSCWTQRTSRVTWPPWLTRLWKNWTSWPTWPTRPTRTHCNLWLRWEDVILLFTIYVSTQACAHNPPPTLPHPLPTCSSDCPPTLHTYVRLLPSPPALYQLLLGHELELGAQKGQFLCKQFSLPSAGRVLLRENSCCGWEEVYVTETSYLESFAKSIKLSSWLNLGRC